MSTETQNPVLAFSSFADRYEKSTGGCTREIAVKLMSLSPPFTNDSKILDNATGTGIVLEEIQKHLSSNDTHSDLRIAVIAADAAAPMIDNLKAKIEHVQNTDAWPKLTPITAHAVPAEKLDANVLPDDTITHAYMNFGLFFCSDPTLAASHIHRCLTSNGTAIVTSWRLLGYLGPVRQTHKTLYPNAEPFKMPFGDSWEDPEYLKGVLVKAGFGEAKVNVTQETAYMRQESLQEMVAMITEMASMLLFGPKGWSSDAEKKEFEAKLSKNLKDSENFSEAGREGARVIMVANVAIAAK